MRQAKDRRQRQMCIGARVFSGHAQHEGEQSGQTAGHSLDGGCHQIDARGGQADAAQGAAGSIVPARGALARQKGDHNQPTRAGLALL